ncbi:hypothetical protein uvFWCGRAMDCOMC403_058 [Freshwater phage uvFW-CGR-AMD-COM-C403]|nr:hypothetical protein uvFWCGRAMDCOMC403_058 [Freshwater phage uvFW-CGR-AMD-COM-C403]
MKTVAKKATPAAIAVLRQATALQPKRKKASDGLLPSAAHIKQSPDSDHNTGYAVDLTHDPKNGIDCAVIFEKLKEDARVKYLIFNGKIWSKEKSKLGNRRYSGSNPHNKHLHVSIESTMGADTSPWFWWMNQPKIINQVKAAITAVPTKKAYPVEDTSNCCKHCPAKK